MPKPIFGPPNSVSTSGSNAGMFDGSILGVWTFNNSLNDLVFDNDFSPISEIPAYTTIRRFQLLQNTFETRKALTFEEDKAFSVSPTYTYNGDFTITFWWYSPGVVGYTRHAITREMQTKIAPIIAKTDYTISDSQTILQNPSFVITEVASSKTANAIQVSLSGNASNITHIATSEPYEPGLRHVMVTYLYAEGRIRIDIDGKPGIAHSGPTTGIPSTGSLIINGVSPGYTSHKTTQVGGYLFDLVMTTFGARENESLKMMRYGYEYITIVGLFGTRFEYFGVSYPQPTTISTNQLLVEGGNIYSSRSNGEILKGTRPIWDKEFHYTNAQEVALLNISVIDPINEEEPEDNSKRIAEWTVNGLKLKGTRVKI